MKILHLILFISLVNSAAAGELFQVKDQGLSKVLPNFEILAKAGIPESIIFVRVIKVQDKGECDGSPQTCPRSTVYITASEYGEFPEQKTFILPKMHNWEFVEWVKFTEFERPRDYVELRLKAQVPNNDTTQAWWQDEYYLLKVNHQNGQWEKQ